MRHTCAQAGCSQDATHLVVESQPLAVLFKSGAGLLCAGHAEEYGTPGWGGVNLGLIEDVAMGSRALLDHMLMQTRGRLKLGAGDSAYIMAWCAWREAEERANRLGGFDEDDARQRFTRWWNDIGNSQLEGYGHRLLDTEGIKKVTPLGKGQRDIAQSWDGDQRCLCGHRRAEHSQEIDADGYCMHHREGKLCGCGRFRPKPLEREAQTMVDLRRAIAEHRTAIKNAGPIRARPGYEQVAEAKHQADERLWSVLEAGPPPNFHNVNIWSEGDRVEIHKVSRWDGYRGRIAKQYPPSELDPSWIAVAIDDEEGVFVFKDHELTRIED